MLAARCRTRSPGAAWQSRSRSPLRRSKRRSRRSKRPSLPEAPIPAAGAGRAAACRRDRRLASTLRISTIPPPRIRRFRGARARRGGSCCACSFRPTVVRKPSRSRAAAEASVSMKRRSTPSGAGASCLRGVATRTSQPTCSVPVVVFASSLAPSDSCIPVPFRSSPRASQGDALQASHRTQRSLERESLVMKTQQRRHRNRPKSRLTLTPRSPAAAVPARRAGIRVALVVRRRRRHGRPGAARRRRCPKCASRTRPTPAFAPTRRAAGTRTETPLRDVPQFINIVPQALIRSQGATTLQDALRNVPGISLRRGRRRHAGEPGVLPARLPAQPGYLHRRGPRPRRVQPRSVRHRIGRGAEGLLGADVRPRLHRRGDQPDHEGRGPARST